MGGVARHGMCNPAECGFAAGRYLCDRFDRGVRYRQEWPDITFAKSGQFFGSTGCNRYFGQYLSEGPDIEVVGNVGMTRMYCHNQAEQEQLLAREIVKIKKFEVRGNRLTLTTEDGLKIEGVRAK